LTKMPKIGFKEKCQISAEYWQKLRVYLISKFRPEFKHNTSLESKISGEWRLYGANKKDSTPSVHNCLMSQYLHI
jgi:hypothetical protein